MIQPSAVDPNANSIDGVAFSSGTRDEILQAASKLFRRRGYYGTSTRAIADAVGIRQPSLFHHFPSKETMLQALLTESLARPAAFLSQLAKDPSDPALSLYRYVRFDYAWLALSRYDLGGLLQDEVLAQKEFEHWDRLSRGMRASIRRLVSEGIRAGVFAPVDADLVQYAISGLLTFTMRVERPSSAEFEGPRSPDAVACFVVRSLLTHPREISRVQRLAAHHDDLADLPLGAATG